MSNLTVRMLSEMCRYEVGSKLGTPVEFTKLVNMAGSWFVSANSWKWLEGRQVKLRPRPKITLAGATWTEVGLTLVETGAFADYSHLSGDTFELETGTGATVGTYEVASRTDDDTIVLASSIGAAADGQTDITGFLANDQVALPSDFDFQAVTAYSLADGLVGSFELVSPQALLDLRTWPGLSTTISFWAAINWVRSAAGGRPEPRLDVWPETTEDAEELVLFYRGGWLAPETDTENLSIPEWCDLLFMEAVKAVVNGFEDPEGGTTDLRLAQLKVGELWRVAVERDALIQPSLGERKNGWADLERPDFRERFSLYRSPVA